MKKVRLRLAASRARAFVKKENEIESKKEKLERVTRRYRTAYHRIGQFLKFFDWIYVSKLLGETGYRLRNQLRREYSDKLKRLKTRRFGSPELNSECVFNRSSLELTPARLEVLSRGPRFGIPPVSVCKEEFHAEFELFFFNRLIGCSRFPLFLKKFALRG